MITESMMYWITRLDRLNVFMGMSISICVFLVITAGAAWSNAKNDSEAHEYMRLMKWSFVAAFIFAIGLVFTPSTKEMAAIYAIPALSRSDVVQKDIPELYDMGIQYLKDKITPTTKE